MYLEKKLKKIFETAYDGISILKCLSMIFKEEDMREFSCIEFLDLNYFHSELSFKLNALIEEREKIKMSKILKIFFKNIKNYINLRFKIKDCFQELKGIDIHLYSSKIILNKEKSRKRTITKTDKNQKTQNKTQESQSSKKREGLTRKFSNYFKKITRSIISNKKKAIKEKKSTNYSSSKVTNQESFESEAPTQENHEIFQDEEKHSEISGQSQVLEKSSEFENFDQNLFRREVIFRFALAEMLRANLEFLGLEFKVCEEFMEVFDQKRLKTVCLTLYENAMRASDKAFTSMSPHKIQVELSYCIFLYEIIGHKEKARRKLKNLFMNSLKDMNRYFLYCFLNLYL